MLNLSNVKVEGAIEKCFSIKVDSERARHDGTLILIHFSLAGFFFCSFYFQISFQPVFRQHFLTKKDLIKALVKNIDMDTSVILEYCR